MAENGNNHTKVGRKPIEIDPAKVEAMASIGCTQTEIAMVLGGTVSTISRRFAKEFAKGQENLKMRLRKKQIEVAMAGNVTMLIWLGKQYLGQVERLEHSGEGGGPIRFIMGNGNGNGNKG
jgi:hypothetical protein